MSIYEGVTVSCPQCAADVEALIAETVNVARAPSVRDRILAGEFHTATCASCSLTFAVERTFLYSDFDRRQFIHVFATRLQPTWPSLEAVALETFEAGFKNAPPLMTNLAAECRVRAVFGIAYLAEKIRLFEAGLDDALIELIKLDVITRTSATHDLVFVARDHAGAIHLAPAVGRQGAVAVNGDRYAVFESDRARLELTWPELFRRPYVSVRRLTATSRPAPPSR